MHGAPPNGKFLRSDNLMMSLKFTFEFRWGSKSIKQAYPLFTPILPQIGTYIMHFNGTLKHLSDVDRGPIIPVHSSNDVFFSWPPTPECQKKVKGGRGQGHVTP